MTSWYNESIGLKVNKFVETPSREAADLLEDREVLDELKKSNPKLLEYVSATPTLLRQLLAYVTQMPKLSDSPARQFKYPMTACELFEEVPMLLRMSMPNQTASREFFEALFGVLSSQEAMSSLLVSYFSRVFEAVCRCQFYEPLVKYLKAAPSTVDSLISSSWSLPVLRCLKWLLIVDDKDSYEVQQWCEFKLQVLAKVCETLQSSSSRDPFLAESLLELLTQIVQRHMIMYHKHELLGGLLEPSRVSLILKLALSTQIYAVAAVRLLTELVIYAKAVEGLEAVNALDSFFAQFDGCLGELLAQLEGPSLKTLQVMELVAQSLRIKRRVLAGAHFAIFHRLLQFLGKYEQCNLLHCKLERIFCGVFEQEENQPLIDYLFRDCDIVGRTVSGLKYQDRFRSYFGFVIRIAKLYTSPTIKQTPAMAQAIEKNKHIWMEFSKNTLEPYLASVNKDLGSHPIEDRDNSEATNIFTVRSFVKDMPEPNRFRMQQASCLEQAPTSLISLDFTSDSNEIIPLKDNGSFGLTFQKSVEPIPAVAQVAQTVTALPISPTKADSPNLNTSTAGEAAAVQPPTQPVPPPGYVPGGISATKSFEDFMKKKRAELETQEGSKSRTPTKPPTVGTSTVEPSSGSARKKNRWQSADLQEPPAKQSKESSASKVQLQLPVIHLFKIRKPEGHPVKTRKICVNRDHKLKLVLDALNGAISAQ